MPCGRCYHLGSEVVRFCWSSAGCSSPSSTCCPTRCAAHSLRLECSFLATPAVLVSLLLFLMNTTVPASLRVERPARVADVRDSAAGGGFGAVDVVYCCACCCCCRDSTLSPDDRCLPAGVPDWLL